MNKDVIFVFGSNTRGVHRSGAAKDAIQNWGAIYGQGHGLQGRCYALATKDYHIKSLKLEEVADNVDMFIKFATKNPELTFLVSKVGCGLAGFTVDEIAPLFKKAIPLMNVFLPHDFLVELGVSSTRVSFDSKDKLAKKFRN